MNYLISQLLFVIFVRDFKHSSFDSTFNLLAGTQWLHSRVEINGYEEYCGTEYRSPGCSEEYSIIE